MAHRSVLAQSAVLADSLPGVRGSVCRPGDSRAVILLTPHGGRGTAAAQASPLARRPYDLRHACPSTWLNGGVYPTQVAEWAGHDVDVLLRIYAKCIVGRDELAKRRISEALSQD